MSVEETDNSMIGLRILEAFLQRLRAKFQQNGCVT
jgi:hypothetical protein